MLLLKRALGINMNTRINRRQLFECLACILNSSTIFGVIWFLQKNPDFANPWSMSKEHWLIGFVSIRVAITFYDWLVVEVVEWCLGTDEGTKLLPTRTLPDKPVRLVALDSLSYLFMFLNSFNEWIFVQRLNYFLWHNDSIAKQWQEINIWNTVCALAVIFIVNDCFYAPSHHILHMPYLYPLIHKHHHRQVFPTNGYLDAGNEHPIEHLLGTLCIWAGVTAAAKTTGAHAVTIFMYFNIHAALAMLNHSPYNVELNALGGWIQYSVGNHEMHHRKFTVNYAQYIMWYDYLMGSYAVYQGPKTRIKNNPTKKDDKVDVDDDDDNALCCSLLTKNGNNTTSISLSSSSSSTTSSMSSICSLDEGNDDSIGFDTTEVKTKSKVKTK